MVRLHAACEALWQQERARCAKRTALVLEEHMPMSGEAHLRRLATVASTSGDWERAWETVVVHRKGGTTSKSSVGPSRISARSPEPPFIRPRIVVGKFFAGKFFRHWST